MPNPNSGNPYMQGANPFMQDSGQPPINGSPNAPAPGPGVPPMPDAGGTSETTKPRQMPAGAPPMGMGADPMGGGQQPVDSVAPLGGVSDTSTPQQPTTATLLRQVRAEIKRDNPDVLIHDAHVLALAVVDMIQTEAAPRATPSPSAPRRARRPSNTRQLGDLNDPRNPNSPLHPQYRYNPRNSGGYYHNNEDDERETDDDRPRPGVRVPLAENAWQRGYSGQHPYAAGAGIAVGEGIVNWWKSRKHTGEHPPGEDHEESRQPPAQQSDFDNKHPRVDLR